MAYDKTKDKEIAKKEVDRGHYKLIVSLFSYDGGQTKMQLSRIESTEKGEVFAKLGRLNKADVLQLLPVMEELASKIDDKPAEEEAVM